MKTLKMTYWIVMGAMVLTLLHHVYGAIIYDTPFRLHIAFVAIPVMGMLALTYHIYRKNPTTWLGKAAFWIFVILTVLMPIGVIGIIEGGYNHLLKNLLYFGGASQSVLDRLFPPPTYEMPDNFLFEFTGILQFFTGILGLYWLIGFLKEKSLTLHKPLM